MSDIHETVLTRYDDENNIEANMVVRVEYTYHRACRGQRDSLGGKRGAGPPLEPDEPAHVEIERVIVVRGDGKAGQELDDLTDYERDKMEQEIMREIADMADRAADYDRDERDER